MRAMIALGVLTILLTGCDGDSDPASKPDPSASTAASTSSSADPTDGLRASVQDYSDAYLTGDGDAAYALLSSRCQGEESKAEFTAIVEAAGELYGSALPFKSFDATLHPAVDPTMASATYTYSISAIDQESEPWVREDGRWLNDDCPVGAQA